jgi:hypothetical protein
MPAGRPLANWTNRGNLKFFLAHPPVQAHDRVTIALLTHPPVSACGDPLRPPRSSPWRGGLSITCPTL